MDRDEVTKAVGDRVGAGAEEAQVIVNEVLGVRVLPDVFRAGAVQRIMDLTKMDKARAERAVNQFIGTAIAARPALFEEVINALARQGGIEDSCRSCDGCRNCGAIELVTQVAQTTR